MMFVIRQMSTGQLGQAQKLRQNIRSRDFRLFQFRKAVTLQFLIFLHGLRLKLDAAHFLPELRKVKALILRHPVRDAVHAFQELIHHRFPENRRMKAVALHREIAVSEGIKGFPKDPAVQEPVLRIDIDLFIRDDCAGEQQLITRPVAELMHSL